MSVIPQRLAQLRRQMKLAKVSAYYVPSTDPHQSEYTPACWQRRQWISGFSGSAGDVLITKHGAGLWTDGRYHVQAADELQGSTITLHRVGTAEVDDLDTWVGKRLGPRDMLGLDPRLITRATEKRLRTALELAGASLKLVEQNLVDRVWSDRPPRPTAPIALHPLRYTGRSTANKLAWLRQALREARATAHVLSALDTIAWLLNVRGQDIPFNPVAIAYAIVHLDRVELFLDPEKVSPQVARALGPRTAVRPYDAFGDALARLGKRRTTIWVDSEATSVWIGNKLKGSKLLWEPSPIRREKARKNPVELRGAAEAHRRDGVAMVRFLAWLSAAVPEGQQTELTIAQQLARFRAQGRLYQGDSFDPICGHGPHGAIVHYSATPKSCAKLKAKGLLLVDSGGQYLDGTTDITRTFLLGRTANAKQKEHFTRVLQGHIALATCRFPGGTTGRQLDTVARLALWRAGLQYNHGTGHGVGSYLCVHEGPQSISPRCTGAPLEPGNILSNEPGYYLDGAYGIRIENLMCVKKDEDLSRNGQVFYHFDELTRCPIDTRLVSQSLLTQHEKHWLNAYHRRVLRELLPLLRDNKTMAWLRRATRAI
jgi:Xaa-Pro aminopeptidase